MNEFNDIKNRSGLAEFLNIHINKMTYILYVKKVEDYYITFEIPKKNGGTRVINAPQGHLKYIQRRLASALYKFQKNFIISNGIKNNISHGFEKEKGILTNAVVHKNKNIILNMDLEDFFQSFHFGRVRGYFHKNRNFELPIEVATVIAQLTCYKGCLPQGAPSSPIITNLICNVLDMRLISIARKYKLDYTRYADDMTFSTNDIKFSKSYSPFIVEVKKVIEDCGFKINDTKTRLLLKNSRQEVTGVVVNEKVNIKREYYKKTRAMAHSLYKYGGFEIDGIEGTIEQLEGRFSFINQIERFNYKTNNKNSSSDKKNIWNLCSREKQYQRFLYYKYFYANPRPLIVTEGKTDIVYLKAALKKYYNEYPRLVSKHGNKFKFNISFLKRTARLEYFLGIQRDGADTMKNIYNFCCGAHGCTNYFDYFSGMNSPVSVNPIILIFDNEQKSDRPLKKFKNHINLKEELKEVRYRSIVNNLYLLTNPKPDEYEDADCEIEDLFDKSVLDHKEGEKSFSRDKKADNSKCYGKAIFSKYIMNNYKVIDFSNFKPMLDDIDDIIQEYYENNHESPISVS